MPLTEIRQLSPRARLGLWRMDEPAATPRERERQSALWLLRALAGRDDVSIGHEPGGRPVVVVTSGQGDARPMQGWSISVSHTRGWAVVVLAQGQAVGVDIEYRSDRVQRIAPRFVTPAEGALSVDQLLLAWSAKEAVYKFFSAQRLHFFDMFCHLEARLPLRGTLPVENLKQQKIVDVSFEFTNDYVLTYLVQ